MIYLNIFSRLSLIVFFIIFISTTEAQPGGNQANQVNEENELGTICVGDLPEKQVEVNHHNYFDFHTVIIISLRI